jgi:hemolysin activation/secretion protein
VRDSRQFLRNGCGVGSLLVALMWSATAAAQQTTPQQTLPSPQQVTPPTPEAREGSTVRVDSREAFQAERCPFDDSSLRFELRKVELSRPDGSPLQPEIAAAVSDLKLPSGDQSIRVVCELRDEINTALRRKGWIASVQIPAQEINDGTLRLQVVTARMVEARVRGNPGPYADLLRQRLEQLQSYDPLNERTVERLLLLAGDVPGLDMQLALRPSGGAQGEVIGEVTINYRRFTVLANAQNYNSRVLGRETAYVRGEYYGLTGLSDLTYVGFSSTADLQEQKIAQVGHIFGLDSAGSTFGGRLSYAWSRPDLDILDYRTDTFIAGVDFTRPLVRSLNTNITAGAGFDYINQITDIYAGETKLPLTRDKLRVLYASVSGDMRDLRMDGSVLWSLRTGLELRKGLDIFGASQPGVSGGNIQSRIDGKSDAFLVRGSVEGMVGPSPWFRLISRGQMQWTEQSLLNYEEFSLGNLTIGRGYDPGANSGDRAVGLSGEAEFDLPITSKVSSQVFGFYDFVYLDNLDRGATERNRKLSSFGGGVRLGLPGMALLEITYAHPKDKALTIDERRPSDRVLVSLSLRFSDSVR